MSFTKILNHNYYLRSEIILLFNLISIHKTEFFILIFAQNLFKRKMSNKTAVLHGIDDLRIENRSIPEPKDDEVLRIFVFVENSSQF